MNPRTVKASIADAERFIARAKELLAVEVKVYNHNDHTTSKRKWQYSSDAPKEQGAVRRASMDLTRSLAEMRKP